MMTQLQFVFLQHYFENIFLFINIEKILKSKTNISLIKPYNKFYLLFLFLLSSRQKKNKQTKKNRTMKKGTLVSLLNVLQSSFVSSSNSFYNQHFLSNDCCWDAYFLKTIQTLKGELSCDMKYASIVFYFFVEQFLQISKYLMKS